MFRFLRTLLKRHMPKQRRHIMMIRNVFLFIAFCVLMLLTTAVLAHAGGIETNDEQYVATIASEEIESNETAFVFMPDHFRRSGCVAGLSVNRFCHDGSDFAMEYKYDLIPKKTIPSSVTWEARRTWTRVIWAISDRD